MHLSELRALPVGAHLLAGQRNEPVVLAGIREPGPGHRLATARVLTVDGTERDAQPRLLTVVPPSPFPDAVVQRPDLTGRTITIERITADVWPHLGLHRGVVRQLAVIRRIDGRLNRVCCVQTDLWGGGDLETAAKAYADECAGRYVPARKENGHA